MEYNELQELKELAVSIDPKNAPYIMEDTLILNKYDHYLSCKRRDKCVRIYDDDKMNTEELFERITSSALEHLKELIAEFDSRYLTPANVKVGDGATVNYYTDRHAGTIVKVTKCTITIRRDKAILDPNFKPEFIIGGFSAHCTNQEEQSYIYEPNNNGELITLRWSKKYNRYGTPGNLTASKGRHEFYDYNF